MTKTQSMIVAAFGAAAFSAAALAQFAGTANPTIFLPFSNDSTPMNVAHHPGFDQYYGSGGGFPGVLGNVWDAAGNPLQQNQAVNLDVIEETGLSEVDPTVLHERGLVHKGALVKVLGRGQVTKAVTVRAHAFSKSAEAALTAAGGTVERLPLPWGDRRPPAKGNQHTNR